MIRIAVCDDEAKILDDVSLYINKYAEKRSNQQIEISRFNSAKDLEITLDDHSFDIFVLDVFIGNEMSREIGGKFITPRGYKDV